MSTLLQLSDVLRDLVKENPQAFPYGYPKFNIGFSKVDENVIQEVDIPNLRAPYVLAVDERGTLTMIFQPAAIRRLIALQGADRLLRNTSCDLLCQVFFQARKETDRFLRWKYCSLNLVLTPLSQLKGKVGHKMCHVQNVLIWRMHDRCGATKFGRDNYERVLPILSELAGTSNFSPA